MSVEEKLGSMTRTELARRAGLHREQISFLLNGHKSPRVELLVKVARALDVTPGQFLDYYLTLDFMKSLAA